MCSYLWREYYTRGGKGGGGKSLGLALLETIAFDSHCLISLS